MAYMAASERRDPKDSVVSDRGDAWLMMRPKWDLINTLLSGTPAMRAKGNLYLPQYEEEDDVNYRTRLERSVLTNFLKKSLRTLSAKPFMRMVTVDDLNPALKPLELDADKEGNSLHVFGHRVFRSGVGKGLSHILVDFPRESSPDGTLAGLRASGAGPYFREVASDNVIAAFSAVVDGEEQYVHVRVLMEKKQRVDPFGEVVVQQILVMEPGFNVIWQLVDEDKEEWVVVDEFETGIDFVPLITFYSDRVDFLVADPPLLDLAYLNVAHWQSASDQRNILSVARFPILAASGVTDFNQEDQAVPVKFRIGPHQIFTASDPQSRIYYVEHTGAAIAAGNVDLENLKEEMALLGMELVLRGRSGRITATAHQMDKAEADTALSQMAVDFEEALNQALRFANAWLGGDKNEPAGEVRLSTQFGLGIREESEFRDLLDSRNERHITHETLLRELKRRSILSEDFDVAAEILALDKEPPPVNPPKLEAVQ